MKKICYYITVFLCLFAFSINTFAIGILYQPLPYEIQEVLSHSFQGYTVKETYPMYDVDEHIVAYITNLSPTGYIIYSNDYVIESSHTTDYPITHKKIYYAGPLQVFEKENSNFYKHLLSNQLVAKEDMKKASDIFHAKQAKLEEKTFACFINFF